MASTYSPKLRFELIGAGEQAGLWGTTTNKNVGQLIEQAIAGVTTVELDSLSGNYTLTALDGAPDQSRSAVVKCTYTSVPASGTVNIIIPTQTKLYVFRNDCGQTIIVKTAAQVSGVTLLNGEATLVFCDGTNAIAGIATAGVGPTTVANGGTGNTNFGAGGFIKSPGGTGMLTASSTVSLTADVSGILPVANGGTGTSSFSSGRVLLGNGGATPLAYAGIANNDVLTWDASLSTWKSAAPAPAGVTSITGSNIGVSPSTGPVTITLSGTNVTNALGYTPYNGSTNPNNYITLSSLSGYAQLSANQTFSGTNTFSGSNNVFTQNLRVNVSGTSTLYLGSGSTGIQWDGSAIGVGIVGGSFWAISSTYIESNQADVRKPGGGPFNASVSDARLKDNVVNYTQGLNAIKQLRPVNYNLNDVTKLGAQTNYKTFTGLIAQEVQQTDLSNMVIPGMEGYLTLDVSELTYTLINAVKELSAQVDALKAEVAALKGA
jgi:hypothetical protein